MTSLLVSPRRVSCLRIVSLPSRLKKWPLTAMIISESRAKSWAYLRENNQNDKSMRFPKVDGVRFGGSRSNGMRTRTIQADVREIDLQ
jgi:hypothetical protein